MIGAALLDLTLVGIGLFGVLALLLVSRKASRTRREEVSLARRTAYRALLADPDPDAFEPLLAALSRGGEEISELLAVLGHVRAPAAVCEIVRQSGVGDALIWRLRLRDPAARGHAALLLGALGVVDATLPVSSLLRDADHDVRHAAIRSLGLLATETAALALIDAMRDGLIAPDRVLEHLGPWASRPLNDAYHVAALRPLRGIVAEALGLIADASAGPALQGLLEDGTEEERTRACRAIGRIGDRRLGGVIEVALRDPSWQVRAQAAAAAGALALNDERVVRLLADGLGDEAWWVRSNSADALRAVGARGLAALETACRGDDVFARDRAREALELERMRAA